MDQSLPSGEVFLPEGIMTWTVPAGEHRLTVMDATGKRVMELRPDRPTVTIQTKTWPSGIYFVTLTNPNGSTTKKIIVQ